MLVPRTRLLLWVGLVATPLAVLAGALPGALLPSALGLVALMAAVAYDALSARHLLAGVEFSLPSLIRLHKGRFAVLEISVHHPGPGELTLRVGIAFPSSFNSPQSEMWVRSGPALARFQWACTPSRRGSFWLHHVYFETRSAWGFWSVRRSHSLASELRVYPDLLEERKNVAALFLKRGALGIRAQRQAGQGREFEKLRDYVHNDSMDDIHWKASAKRGHPVTKVFQVERTQEVYVVVDASRLTGRELQPGGEVTVLERFVSAALILGWAAEQQGDQFGLITFSDRVLSFVRAKGGQSHYDACRERLYDLESAPVAPDFEALCSFIRVKLRKRALLIVLTALEDPLIAQAFTSSMELISRQHLVLVDMLNPPEAQPLFTEPVDSVPAIYRNLAGHLQWQQLRELQQVLRRRGIRLALLESTRLPAELVAQHAEVKARQLL